MIIEKINKLSSLFLRMAKTVGVTTFHGTDASNITNIISKGLLAKSPVGAPHAAKAIYLTNTIETAARYCRDFENPVVLEIYISSPRRVNKLQQDPLDMDESLYENYDNETFFSDDVRRIEEKINKIFNTNRYSCPIDLPDEIESFRGFNLYGAIKDHAKSIGMDLQDVKNKMKVLLPEQELDYIKINQSGIITLLPSVYDSFHQMYYRENIPAIAIKAVWVPKNKLKEGSAEGKEEKNFGRRLIPADIRPLQYIIDKFRSDFWERGSLGSSIEKEDMDDVIERLEDTDMFGLFKEKNSWGEPSFIDQLKILRDDFENANEEDQKIIKSKFYSKFLDLEPLDPGEIAGEETWVRIPIENLDSLSQVTSMYKEASFNYINKVYKLTNNFYKLASKYTENEINEARKLLEVLPTDDAEEISHKYHIALNNLAPKEIINKLKNDGWVETTPKGWVLNFLRAITKREAPPSEFNYIKNLIRPLNEALEIALNNAYKPKLEDEDIDGEELDELVKELSIPSACKVVRIGEYYLEEKDDSYRTVDPTDAENIFNDVGIRPGDNEIMYFAAICDGEIIGAATIGKKEHDSFSSEENDEENFDEEDELAGGNCYTFSIAINPEWQRKNLGRELVNKIIEEVKSKGGHELNVWVVNPNMAKLLESMGFDTEGPRGWSQDSPHMTLYL